MSDEKDNEPRLIEAHSPSSVILVVILFFAIMYGMSLLSDYYHQIKSNPISIDNRVCDSYKGSKTPPAIPAYNWNDTGLITLWFDDGWLTQYTTAFPIMKEKGLVGAVAIATKFVCKAAFVTWDNLHTMQNDGWEMTAHTISHSCDLSYYNKGTTVYELAGSKKIIEDHGLRADNFVMPCGYGEMEINALYGTAPDAPPIISVAKEYFKSYRTGTSLRLNPIPVVDNYNLKALQLRSTTTLQDVKDAIANARKDKSWLILVFHQIDNSQRIYSIPENEFIQVLDLVKASGLPVVLPTQALDISAKNSPSATPN